MTQPDSSARKVSESDRREFLRDAGIAVVAVSLVGLAACAEDSNEIVKTSDDAANDAKVDDDTLSTDGAKDDETGGKADDDDDDDAPGDGDGDDDDGGDADAEEKPDGVEVKLTPKTKQIGGSEKVSDAGVLKELGAAGALLLVRVDDKTIAANTIACTHQACDVEYDKAKKNLSCPCHGSRFSLDGKVVNGPAGKPLTHFNAVIAGESVFLTK